MNSESLLSKFDRLIKLSKDHINEKNKRNEVVKKIEIEAADILSGILTKKDEIKGLLAQIGQSDDDVEISRQLAESLAELDFIERNSIVYAEKKWVQDCMAKERERIWKEQIQERKDYVDREINRLKSELHEVRGFFEIAEFVNQIWADQELFLEFNRLDEIMKVVVARMNETNQKGLETHLSRNTLKTLEHIRVNLFKVNCWLDEEISEYQSVRNREIKKLRAYTLGGQKKIYVTLIGGAKELLELIVSDYPLPVNIIAKWEEPSQNFDNPEVIKRLSKSDVLLVATFFESSEIFQQILNVLNSNKIKYELVPSLNPDTLHKTIEGILSKIK